MGETRPFRLIEDRLSLAALAGIGVALIVMAIKYVAYLKTGSVALYSDALESIVNVVSALAALIAIRVSARPADSNHPFGHHKAEFFAAVLEGSLIVVAALLILREAYDALITPRTLNEPALGLAISGIATVLNALWATALIRWGRAWRSPALSAGGWHVFADVLTSVGVLLGVGLAAVTGWNLLDPVIAAAVALHILWTGFNITRRSMSQLMDEAAGSEITNQIKAAIKSNGVGALQVHDIRTRTAGRALFIEFHLVVPGAMTVAEAHEICDRLENAIEGEIDGAEVVIHVEPENKAKAKGAVDLEQPSPG